MGRNPLTVGEWLKAIDGNYWTYSEKEVSQSSYCWRMVESQKTYYKVAKEAAQMSQSSYCWRMVERFHTKCAEL